MSQTIIHGTVAPGFETVKTEFEKNFTQRGELGAACAIYHRGQKVVDLWGGLRDETTPAPWQEDTLVLVFSTSKGVSALTIALAHSRGLLDYEEKVATYWPEFAQNGKETITVRQLLAHQAGLCAIDEPLPLETLADLDAMAEIIAKQKPAWKPGTHSGYHCWSLGWYQNELIRRVDPQQRSLGQFFQEEIAQPLGIEFYIGLPTSVPDHRIATIKGIDNPLQILRNVDKMPPKFLLSFLNPNSLTVRTMGNPKVLYKHDNMNQREVRAVEVPSGNGIGQARALAKLYSEFATGGHQLNLNPETLAALSAPAVPPALGTYDKVLKAKMAFSLGFWKPAPYADYTPFGSSTKAFGFAGAGGSFAFADPEAQVGFAYAMNKVGGYMWDDPREKSLRDAFYRSLAAAQAGQPLANMAA